MTASNESTLLDPVDLALLQQLEQDASLSNLALAERLHLSAPTCLRRVKRLQQAGYLQRLVALLDTDRLARTLGHGLEAIVEVTLERQGAEALEAFEQRVVADPAVQQCWRVSPGPDFILQVRAADMPGYLALQQRLLTTDANVRNVKAFFSVKRAKFAPGVFTSTAS